MQDFKVGHNSATPCGRCKANTQSGTHNGCEKCGKVKHTANGKRAVKEG